SGATVVDADDRQATVDATLASQLVRFASVGAVSTVLFAGLFSLLAGPVGPIAADAAALGACALANTAANRRLTFAWRGRSRRRRQYATGTALAVLPLALTLLALVALGAAGVTGLVPQLVTL